MIKPYRIDDLSQGIEELKIPVVNEYNYEKLVNFDYIKTSLPITELSPKSTVRFLACMVSIYKIIYLDTHMQLHTLWTLHLWLLYVWLQRWNEYLEFLLCGMLLPTRL
jgi:hypothetical protein